MVLEGRNVHADPLDDGETGEDADERPEGDNDIADGFLGTVWVSVSEEVGDCAREMWPRRRREIGIEDVVHVDMEGACAHCRESLCRLQISTGKSADSCATERKRERENQAGRTREVSTESGRKKALLQAIKRRRNPSNSSLLSFFLSFSLFLPAVSSSNQGIHLSYTH